ncbi:amino acid adenylation domain-containing protein [Serratia entomophila]|uniref:Amino acid adenylation domain-containing protein n=1 Tax=Serratia entomophila TaxID=42906 RepID=A0ABY5CPC5_9GAMM|nr:non-ribosomal peptide synthetase [Serratia entomophila]USU99359.1 amino acid adenylation domain-containing protein [Serratia entomophila]CAI0737355.1 Tyrocidine synthase III [Serratia entomophila]CAI1526165.1 Tyrocidine synthase III [Serratia entomophila]
MEMITVSPYTQTFWNEYVLNPQSCEYNLVLDQTIEGDLDIDRLRAAVERVSRDYILFHHVLDDTHPQLRWVKTAKPITLEMLDAECDVGRLANTPFDLRAGPLCRFYLIERAPRRYQLMIIVHHVLIDGLAGQEFYGAVAAYYNDPAAIAAPGDIGSLNALYQRYEQDIATLKETCGSPAFWRELLADCPPRVELPYLANRRAAAGSAGEVRFTLPFDQWQSLKGGVKFANPFLIFKTLWALLIARQSPQEKVYIGYPIAAEGGEALYSGAQVNSAVFPLALTPGATFRELYQATLGYSKALRASGRLRHTRLPVYDMLRQSQIRQLNVNFTQAYLKDAPLALEGCQVTVNHRFNVDLAGSELLLEYQPSEQGFEFRLRYRADLFDETQMAEMAEQYGYLLRRVLSEPDLPIAALPQLTPQQARRMRDQWASGQDVPPAPAATLLDGVERYAGRHPERIALVDAAGEIAYGQLAQRSSLLALRLRAEYLRLCGEEMPADTVIPLYMQRGAAAVVAMLAIMKAGGAYVPLDPDTPDQRLAYILQDVNSPIVVTDGAGLDAARRLAPHSLCLLADAAPEPGDTAPLPTIDARQLAYVIYTSGTTGRPKGTLCEHRGAVNMVRGHAQRLLRQESGVLNCLQFASLAFDAHVFEVFIALGNGHRLFIAGDPQRRDPALLADQMAAWRIHFCFLPPALLATLPTLPDSVRHLGLGGEATSQDVLAHYLAQGLQVVNMYGPTEAAVSVCLNIYRRNGARNIGHAIANMHCYVADADCNLLPLGAEGELCLSGVGLAREYLNMPELTASAFVDNPFSQEADYRRLYRTGDRVRRLADGSLEYLGRQDQQVKIHGYRIELGEIEMQMRAMAEVAEAVVAVRRQPTAQLQAWYVLQPGCSLSAAEICRRLAAQLPHYMLPTALLAVPAIPLTVSRKVDFRALPEPEAVERQAAFRQPGSPLESRLLALFNQLLDCRAGVDDHFFRLGGNSILAIRLCHEVNRRLGMKMSAQTLNQYPTVAMLSEHLGAPQPDAPDEVGVTATGRREGPLSSQQSRLWFMQQLAPASVHYLSPVLLQLAAGVDGDRYRQSLQAVAARHQVLRSLIRQDEQGVARQTTVDAPLAVPLHVLSAGEFSAALTQALQQPMDLTREPPLRAALYRYTDEAGRESTASLLVFHHIAFDGWSLEVLLQELDAEYRRIGQPPAALQYLDYALWQQTPEQLGAQAQALAFWRRELEGCQPLCLPLDAARSGVFDLRGDNCEARLPAELVSALEALARREGVTLHAVLLAGFSLLLSRYAGQDDVLVGTPLANRSRPELANLIGFFVNTLPLRQQIDHRHSVTAFIRQVAETTLRAQQHQALSLEVLVDSLQLPRDFSRHPLFQVMFALENDGAAAHRPDWLSVVDLSGCEETAKFDLTLTLTPDDGQMRARFNFAVALFSKASVARLAEYYLAILQQMARHGDWPLEQLSLQPHPPAAGDARALQYPFERPLQQDFIRHARRNPQAVAIVDALGEMTYGELYIAALTLATQLRLQGQMVGEAIAIVADKGRKQPVAMLAALMCGKAFLPMDASWPPQRRLRVMAQAGVNTLLSDEDWTAEGINRIELGADGLAHALPAPARLLPAIDAAAGDLAYIIFTSGSTGTPKGVAIEHRSVVNMIEGVQRYFAFDERDRSLALSALSFDLAIYDIFGPLSAGGAVVMPAERDRANPQAWYQLMIAHRVTQWLSAPALMELLLDYVKGAGLTSGPEPALRAVMVGGDWIATSLPARCREWAPHSRFCSAGGATEAAVFSMLHEVPPGQRILSASIPYGRPLPHQRCHILDAWLRPAPAGVRGEIYLAGEGLARGYYGDPQRTADSFFWHEGLQERVYRTGDAGRLLEDGNVEFMGRIDSQVKLNGYRIELGEIENIALTCPGVTACCVVPIAHPQPYLAAYFVAGDGVDAEALARHLSGQLPQYMMPRALVPLAQLPLTENGKIARQALPQPEGERRAFAAAQDAWEQGCVDIWRTLLKLPEIGVEDNFFALGGNSILAIQACYQIGHRLQREVTLGELGQFPTIRSLCQALRLRGEDEAPLSIPALQRQSYPLSSSQMQLWFIENLNGGSALYHVPMLFRFSEAANLAHYARSLQAVVARHQALHSRVCQSEARIAVSRPHPAALVVQRLQTDAESWRQGLQRDIDRPFDLAAELPIRAVIYDVEQPDGATLHYGLILVHHLAFDGWSQRLLLQELDGLYQAQRQGLPPALPAPALQYGDYAVWQQDYLGTAQADAAKDYWRQRLAGWQTLEMPLDLVRPAQFDHRGANHAVALPAALVAQAASFAQREGVTPFALYLAAFNLLLGYFSGQQDILVGIPVANRPTAEARSAIGFFVNTLPLRSQIDDEQPLADYVRDVFNAVLQAQRHQGLPLELIIDLLQVPRDLSRHPLFQTMFVLEDGGAQPALPDWLTPQSLVEHYQAAKFDLTLSIHLEQGEGQAVFNYATALFSPATLERLAGYYQAILQQIVAQGSRRVGQLALVPAAEVARQRAFRESCPPVYDFERAIHHDFIRQAAQHPQRVAIVDALGELTYGELYRLALTLSLQLRQHADMSAETLAVMVDKGRAQIVAVLAILMAGKAYLPLDGAWPEQRRLDILGQSQTRVILSSRRWRTNGEARLLVIDPQGVVAELPPAAQGEPVLPAPSALAYVIFTSGSTGTPKGVAIEHRGAVNSIVDTLQQLAIGAEDRGLALSALSFDISVFDIFGLLSVGGALVMPSEAERYQPQAWHRLLMTQGVTFWNSAPSVMTLLVEHLESDGETAHWPALRNAVLVGEVIARPLPARIRQRRPGCRVVSAGGATESSIWSILYDIPDAPITAPSVPYGQAMAHQRFYVLDRQLRLLPPCLPGEQYIGGAGVARGYYRNQPLTDERFIYHPELGERLYRTGDAGRYLPDGNLEFLGRMDFQVKINGYRVELAEVEQCALAFGPIKSCCAIVRQGASQELLALYYVCDEPLAEPELLAFMSRQLPLYMIPTALMRLEALPYGTSGKLDRKALPAPEMRETQDYVAPESALERQLCALWQEALQLERVGMTDDFFSLGGTSIKAISLCLAMSALLGAPLPVVKLFRCRSLRNLLSAGEQPLVAPLNKATDAAPALWMIHPALVGAEAFHPFAQRLQGKLNCYGVDNYNLYHRPTIDSLGELAERYLSEMIANGLLNGAQPVRILGWSLGGLIALEIAARLEARGVRDVHLYLLDSFYQQRVAELPVAELLPLLGIEGEAARRAAAVAEVEGRLAAGTLSRGLQSTRVTLFKAMQLNPQLPQQAMMPLLALADNGLSAVCHSVQVIPLACHHHNILQCGEEIGAMLGVGQ